MIRISRNGKEIKSLGDWKEYAPPKGKDGHWEDGKSAKELARAWCPTSGVCPPAEFVSLLQLHPYFADVALQDVFPEQRLSFDRYAGEPRNADLNIVGRRGAETIAISVEGKADEPFGSSVKATLAAALRRRAVGKTTNADARLQDLIEALLPAAVRSGPNVGKLPYQLFTAVAGLLAWAQSLRANAALLVVHEFVGGRRSDGRAATTEASTKRNAKALDAFLSLVAGSAVSLGPREIVGPFRVPGNSAIPGQIPLYVGKARRNLARAGA